MSYGQNVLCQKPEKKAAGTLINLYKISQDIYRSDQPEKNDMLLLEKMGIKTIVNLRNGTNDNHEAKGTSLNLIHIPMHARAISYEKMLVCFKQIEKAEKPLLIHCHHGSDRTGCVIAIYRMMYCGWTREEAMSEFLREDFGYHKFWFPNIRKFIENIDIEKFKADLKDNK
jgi:protein tyrosine/serine phosphatase